ncbi:MAG TPA: alpha-isopropylmalate synthase regulatory domain-containing protein, partial [bacterium]|nr:alpha-isopropylmalate synthase regulatory domain-containing protein [bacterium]
AGKSNLIFKAGNYGAALEKHPEILGRLLERIKRLEYEGYEFENAEGSFRLLLEDEVRGKKDFFQLKEYRVIVEEGADGDLRSEATVKVKVGSKLSYQVAEGDGPVNALDSALRKALESFYPPLKDVTLTDFKVRVLNAQKGTAAKVRVFIESRDREEGWVTVGVSENIIEASLIALLDSIRLKLLKKK